MDRERRRADVLAVAHQSQLYGYASTVRGWASSLERLAIEAEEREDRWLAERCRATVKAQGRLAATLEERARAARPGSRAA